MRFGERVLFEDVTCTFQPGRRYAITGPNGAGKSTLMKILCDEMEPSHGSVTRPKKLGVLRQDQFAFDEFRVIDTVIMGNALLWKALVEREVLHAKPHESLTDKDGMRLADLEGIVGEEGGYSAEADAAILLDGLGLEEDLYERKMRELQGGQKVRVLLAQALFGNPPALLLDEPTNHLDLDSVHWLQDYLCDYEGVLIVISHDRHFLNSVSHPHGGHRLPNRHHVQRRIRRHGRRENVDSRTHRIGKRAAREENRTIERVYRPLFRRHAFGAGHLAQERSRTPENLGACAIEYRPALHPVSDGPAFRKASARD